MKKIYLLILMLCFAAGLLAVPQFNFKKYQVENGLSHNTVWCILQDSYGFMWFGTSDGLNRFDGRDFIIYRNDHNEALSLGNNSVQSLFEDADGNLWVGTVNGIYIYQRRKDNFIFFDKKTEYGVSISSEVKKIIRTETGNIWIGTLGQGIFIFDPETGQLTQNSILSSFVWDICEDKSHRIYISSPQDGLICLDQNGKYIETYSAHLSDEEKAKFSRISCIQSISNRIWFSLGNNRLCMLDNRTKQVNYYDDNTQDIGVIRCIERFSEHEILIGSDNGLYIFDMLKENFSRIDNPVDTRSLSDQTVNAILKDAEGGFWISTYLGGVNYLGQQSKTFEYYPVNTGLKAGKVVNQFCEDKDHNIWIGTQDGLRIFDNRTRTVETYNLPGKNKNYDIRAILIDGDDLWIGTFSDGLKILDTRTGKMKEYYHLRNKANSICSNDVLTLFKDSRGNIFVGTSWGMCKYNKGTDDFMTLMSVSSMAYVTDVNEDSHGNLWITSYNQGIFRINVDNYNWRRQFIHDPERSNSITSNSVICTFEDMHGNMWFGTNGSGLCYYERETESFVNFDEKGTVLPNKVIYSIEEDNLGFFWISTNAGLLYINPSNKASGKLFTKDDGLQSNQFNFNASLKSTSGKLYFGGIDGFNSFYPEEFQDNTYIPPVYITDIRLNSGSRNNKLEEHRMPSYLREDISLPFNSNNITFRFAALSYEKSYRNKYSYILEGFDREWIESSTSNIATYTNLPPGNYIFRVRGSNNDGRWNEEGAILYLRILPPWWRSTIAYIIYGLLIVGVGLLLFRYWSKRTDRKIQAQMKEYELKKEKEVYQSKINFFINLVHEIRTPLSLINLPLEKLSDTSKNNPKANRYLSIINKNVNYLLGIVNQLLDFQKIESTKSELDIKQHDLKLLLKDIYNQFVNVCELKNIELSLIFPDNEVLINVDKDVLNKIIFNLLGNAVKYAAGKIELRLELFNDRFDISVGDDGPGIPESEKNKIFEAFYQLDKDNNSSGTGIGLAFSKMLSEKHNGSISIENSKWNGALFKLSVPVMPDVVGSDGLTPEETVIRSDLKIIEEGGFNSCKVLLVEDNAELLTLTEESLSENFTVYKAMNGQEALNILEKENIDLVVSDVMMPVMDGFELTKTIKSDLNYSHIPVILLTAKVADEFHLEGMEYGADVYLGKPFPVKLLIKQIENLLKLRIAFRKMISVTSSIDTFQVSISKRDNEFVRKLYTEIDKHLAEFEFSIDNIAETMFMSRSNFYRKIKGLTGMSPNDFLKTYRLNKAAELLRSGDCRIKEVYEQVGFNSSSYFAKCFKAQFGVLPKEYASRL